MKTLKDKQKNLRVDNALDDDLLDKVNGGYLENSGFSAGVYIECPRCHETNRSWFDTTADTNRRCDEYHCRNCGLNFDVYSDGRCNW